CHAGKPRRNKMKAGDFSTEKRRRTRTAVTFRSCLRLGMPAVFLILTILPDDMPEREFTYVYILRSEICPDRHYTGCTKDLSARLKKHNLGSVPHTAKFKPWSIETAISFRSEEKAQAFEKYLKSGSGREFARRHF
ncbi:MAG: GIY-YIG nuclease family protein, partial [Opitutales bacterium]